MPISLSLDLQNASYSALRSLIASHQGSEENIELVIEGCEGHDGIGAGLRFNGTVSVKGSLGDFCFLSYGLSDAHVDGNAGEFLGHSIHSGSITVRGSAGACVGALGVGGLITVYGNALDRSGVMLRGGDVVIRGNVGAMAGLGMLDGSLVIGGNAGPELGKGMKGGSIFLRGEAASISPHVEEVRMRERDKLKFGLLMLKSGIKATGREFKLYRAVA